MFNTKKIRYLLCLYSKMGFLLINQVSQVNTFNARRFNLPNFFFFLLNRMKLKRYASSKKNWIRFGDTMLWLIRTMYIVDATANMLGLYILYILTLFFLFIRVLNKCHQYYYDFVLNQRCSLFRTQVPVPSKGIQIPPPLRSGKIFMKDAECAEQNEKRNKPFLQFLVFKLCGKIRRKLTISWVQKLP